MALIDLWKQRVADNLSGVSNLNVTDANAGGYKGHNSPDRPEEDTLIKNKSTDAAEGVAYFKGLEKPSTQTPGSMKTKTPFTNDNIGNATADGFSTVFGNPPTADSVFSADNFTPHQAGQTDSGSVSGFGRGVTGRLYDIAAAQADYSTEPAATGDSSSTGTTETGEDTTETGEDAAGDRPNFADWKADQPGGHGTVGEYRTEFGIGPSEHII